MLHQVIFKPIADSRLTTKVVDANGVVNQERVVGVMNSNYANSLTNFVKQVQLATNLGAVAEEVVVTLQQPSTAQLDGLIGYLQAIGSGTNTAAVETAIAGL